MKISIFTDGGSRGNPGKAATGVVIKNGEKTIHTISNFMGIATNNEAEYSAFQTSIEWLLSQKEHEITRVEWFLDSMLVVEQLNKKWKIKEPRLQEFATKIWFQLKELSLPYSISHVRRELNKEADALVNATLDAN